MIKCERERGYTKEIEREVTGIRDLRDIEEKQHRNGRDVAERERQQRESREQRESTERYARRLSCEAKYTWFGWIWKKDGIWRRRFQNSASQPCTCTWKRRRHYLWKNCWDQRVP